MSERDDGGPTDLEIVRACAEAMDLNTREVSMNQPQHTIRIMHKIGPSDAYWPLTNDEQMVALIRKHGLCLWGGDYSASEWKWHAETQIYADEKGPTLAHGDTANRAVCMCVYLMHTDATLAERVKPLT